VGLVRTDVSDERIASIIRVTRNSELGTMLAVTGNRSTLRRNTKLQLLVTADIRSLPILITLMTEAMRSSETSVLATAIRRHIPEDGIVQYVTRLTETSVSYRAVYCRMVQSSQNLLASRTDAGTVSQFHA
jgi:hypothetical protein